MEKLNLKFKIKNTKDKIQILPYAIDIRVETFQIFTLPIIFQHNGHNSWMIDLGPWYMDFILFLLSTTVVKQL